MESLEKQQMTVVLLFLTKTRSEKKSGENSEEIQKKT